MDEISHDTKLFARPYISEIRPCVGIFIISRDISSKKKKKKSQNHPAKYLVRKQLSGSNRRNKFYPSFFFFFFLRKKAFRFVFNRRLNTRYISFKASDERRLGSYGSYLALVDAKRLISFARAFPYEFLLPSYATSPVKHCLSRCETLEENSIRDR